MHTDKVQITSRDRFVWPVSEYEEVSHISAWTTILKDKDKFPNNHKFVAMVQKILARLFEVELGGKLQPKLYILYFDRPNAMALPGRIFFNTNALLDSRNVDEAASMLGHEIGHIVARHSIESNIGRYFAMKFSKRFGFRGPLRRDYVTSKLFEAEADHIGLILMAQADFNSQERLDQLERKLAAEARKNIEPWPEVLQTHPSTDLRIKQLKALLP
ncbi:hypothetical protein BDZ45DRAFT_406359 [Acephala macrosclerotiorum]|nr:hypothetical protein BDZ45DRAFT_406359 [Acephala macrosclerotiorum]